MLLNQNQAESFIQAQVIMNNVNGRCVLKFDCEAGFVEIRVKQSGEIRIRDFIKGVGDIGIEDYSNFEEFKIAYGLGE